MVQIKVYHKMYVYFKLDALKEKLFITTERQ